MKNKIERSGVKSENDIERLIKGELSANNKWQGELLPTTKAQTKVLRDFYNYCTTVNKTTDRKYELIRFARHFVTVNIKKEFNKITAADLQKYFKSLVNNGASKFTIKGYAMKVKLFFKWYYSGSKNRQQLEDLIDWMKDFNFKADTKNRTEQATFNYFPYDKINQLLPHCQNIRDKAIVTALMDCGYRSSEFLAITMKDIKMNGDNMSFKPENIRESLTLTRSQQFIEKWRSVHPDKDNPDASLWITMYGDRMCDNNLRRILKQVGKKAGFVGLRAHLMRHGFATHWAQNFTPHELSKALGHKDISMISKFYVHLEISNLQEKQAKAEGREIVQDKDQKTITDKIACMDCFSENSIDSLFCGACGKPMTEEGKNINTEQAQQIKDLQDSIAEQAQLYRLVIEGAMAEDKKKDEEINNLVKKHNTLVEKVLKVESFINKLQDGIDNGSVVLTSSNE